MRAGDVDAMAFATVTFGTVTLTTVFADVLTTGMPPTVGRDEKAAVLMMSKPSVFPTTSATTASMSRVRRTVSPTVLVLSNGSTMATSMAFALPLVVMRFPAVMSVAPRSSFAVHVTFVRPLGTVSSTCASISFVRGRSTVTRYFTGSPMRTSGRHPDPTHVGRVTVFIGVGVTTTTDTVSFRTALIFDVRVASRFEPGT